MRAHIYNEETQSVSWKDINSSIRDDSYFAITEKDGVDYKNVYFVITGQDVVFDGQKVTVVNNAAESEPDSTQEESVSSPDENDSTQEESVSNDESVTGGEL